MPLRRGLSESSGTRLLSACRSYGAGRVLACAEFALGQNSNNLKESPIDLQPLTANGSILQHVAQVLRSMQQTAQTDFSALVAVEDEVIVEARHQQIVSRAFAD